MLDLIIPSFYKWSGATLIAIYPALEPFSHRSCRCLINWIPSQCLGSVPWILFILSPTFPRLGMSISLGLMLLLDKTKYQANHYLVITWWTQDVYGNSAKSPLLNCLWQLSYALLRCVLIFGSPTYWLLTLWLPLSAIPPSHSACFYATQFMPCENSCGLYVQ